MPVDWDSDDVSEGLDLRPPDVTLAVKLLGGSVAFHLVVIFELWSRMGLSLVAQYPVAWIRPGILVISALLIALVWKGSL